MQGVLAGLAIGWAIALLILYHKVFTVYYFDLGAGLLKELIGSIIGGAIMAALTVYLWYVTAIIIIIFGISLSSKKQSRAPLIIAIIFAIVIAITGIAVKSQTKEEKTSMRYRTGIFSEVANETFGKMDDSRYDLSGVLFVR